MQLKSYHICCFDLNILVGFSDDICFQFLIDDSGLISFIFSLYHNLQPVIRHHDKLFTRCRVSSAAQL